MIDGILAHPYAAELSEQMSTKLEAIQSFVSPICTHSSIYTLQGSGRRSVTTKTNTAKPFLVDRESKHRSGLSLSGELPKSGLPRENALSYCVVSSKCAILETAICQQVDLIASSSSSLARFRNTTSSKSKKGSNLYHNPFKISS
jgi:hypothetical protein